MSSICGTAHSGQHDVQNRNNTSEYVFYFEDMINRVSKIEIT